MTCLPLLELLPLTSKFSLEGQQMKLYTDKSGGLNGKTCCRAGNELDTLDGVQLQWFVGARRDVAKFHETAVGPIVNVTPLRSGKAQVLSSEEITSFMKKHFNRLLPADLYDCRPQLLNDATWHPRHPYNGASSYGT